MGALGQWTGSKARHFWLLEGAVLLSKVRQSRDSRSADRRLPERSRGGGEACNRKAYVMGPGLSPQGATAAGPGCSRWPGCSEAFLLNPHGEVYPLTENDRRRVACSLGGGSLQ